MRLAAAVILLAPSIALANPTLELGAGVGRTQNASDAEAGMGTMGAVNLYGRLHVLGPLAAQVELGHIDLGDQSSVRSASALAVAELVPGRLVPIVLAGVGVDQQSTNGGSSDNFIHAEIGLGLQYVIADGLTVGVDIREGKRSSLEQKVYAQGAPGGGFEPPPEAPAPMSMSEGEYRSVRATLGVRF